jgi:ATP-dependent exoDNAse (exonuclease V) beta subunit
VILDARSRVDPRPHADDADVRSLAERRDEDLRVLYVAVTRAKHRLGVIRGERDWLGLYDL